MFLLRLRSNASLFRVHNYICNELLDLETTLVFRGVYQFQAPGLQANFLAILMLTDDATEKGPPENVYDGRFVLGPDSGWTTIRGCVGFANGRFGENTSVQECFQKRE